MNALAVEANVPLLLQPSWRAANYPGFVAHLKSFKPHLFVINSYSMILRADLLAVPGRGTVNIHGALLPQYRGANVTEWALINEERMSGVTMHVVDSEIDTGPVIGQLTVPLTFEDTWVDARRRINEATRKLLSERMPDVLAGRYSAIPQSEGRHWPRRSEKDGRFEWRQPLRHIYNLVRALVAPHPGVSWDKPDGTAGTLNHWTSLAELAVLKAGQRGDWRYDDLLLSPKPALPTKPVLPEMSRKAANTVIIFDVKDDQGGVVGSAMLRDIDCYGGSAGAELHSSGKETDRISAALMAFLRDELDITYLSHVGVH
jgi:folate-dependent phosphoribosylglycinamide formyltransferase PurN